jgi:hypothetical protein
MSWTEHSDILKETCRRCLGAPGFGEKETTEHCTWIGHFGVINYTEPIPNSDRQRIVYVDTVTGTAVFRGTCGHKTPPSPSEGWPGFIKLRHQVRALQAQAQQLTGGESMAKLYLSSAGDRAAGLVCNRDEATIQAQTFKGLVRVVAKPNGDFSIYVADVNHENVIHLMDGNMDARTAKAAGDGKGVAALSLSDPLPRIHVKNRGAKHTPGMIGGGGPSSSAPATPAKTATTKSTSASAATSAKAAPSQPATKSGDGSKKPTASAKKSAEVKASELKDLAEGVTVKLVAKGNDKLKAEVGETGKVEAIKLDGMLGPQARVKFEKAGVQTIFHNEGDRIAAVTK